MSGRPRNTTTAFVLVALCGCSGRSISLPDDCADDCADSGATPVDPSAARPVPTDFADARVPQDFTDPVILPAPSTTIAGDVKRFVGTWSERDSQREVCSYCRRVVIRALGDGTFQGTFFEPSNGATVTGPFAPPTDPTKGYPTELSPAQYGVTRSFTAGVTYRVFDGIAKGAELTFWFSPLDLWTDWCGMQTPSVWNMEGKTRYRCVPQTADLSSTDLGRLVLCTSADELPQCSGAAGLSEPCVCQDVSSKPLCSAKYCECSATECHADLRGVPVVVQLTLEDGALTLVGSDPHFLDGLKLVKMAP
jgi:hypothetical protein